MWCSWLGRGLRTHGPGANSGAVLSTLAIRQLASSQHGCTVDILQGLAVRIRHFQPTHDPAGQQDQLDLSPARPSPQRERKAATQIRKNSGPRPHKRDANDKNIRRQALGLLSASTAPQHVAARSSNAPAASGAAMQLRDEHPYGSRGSSFRTLSRLVFRNQRLALTGASTSKGQLTPAGLNQQLRQEAPTATAQQLAQALHNCLVLRISLPLYTMQGVYQNPLFHNSSVVTRLPPRELFKLLRALSFQPNPNPRALRPLFFQLHPHFSTFSPSEIVGMVVALSACHLKLSPLLESISTLLSPAMPALTIQDLYSLAVALADLHWHDQALITALTDHALPLLPQLHSTFRLARLLSYLTHQKLLHHHPTALDSILACIGARAADFDAPALPSLLGAVGGCPRWRQPLQAAILPIVLPKVPTLSPKDLVSVLREGRAASVDWHLYNAVLQRLRLHINALHQVGLLVAALHTAGSVQGEDADAFLQEAATRVASILPECKPDQAAKLFQAYSTRRNSIFNPLLLELAARLIPLLPKLTEASLICCLQALPSVTEHMLWALAPAGSGLMQALVRETVKRVNEGSQFRPRVGHDLDRLALAALKELPRCGLLNGAVRESVVFRLMQADFGLIGEAALSEVLMGMEGLQPCSAAPRLKVELLRRLASTAPNLRPAHLAELLHTCQDELRNSAVPPLHYVVGLALLQHLPKHTLYTIARILLTVSKQPGGTVLPGVLDRVGDHIADCLLPAAPARVQTARSVGRLLFAYTSCGRFHARLFDAVRAAVLQRLLPHMQVEHCAYLLRAFAQMGCADKELFARVAEHLVQAPQDRHWKGFAVVVAEAYALAGHVHPELLDCLVDRLLLCGYFTARHAASMVRSYGLLDYHSEVLLDAAAEQIKERLGDVSLQALHAVLDVYTRFDHPMQHVLRQILIAIPLDAGAVLGPAAGAQSVGELQQGRVGLRMASLVCEALSEFDG